MVRGRCTRCRRMVGGFLKPPAWLCPKCRELFCERCARATVGIIWKKRLCPACSIEMQDVSNSRWLEFPRAEAREW